MPSERWSEEQAEEEGKKGVEKEVVEVEEEEVAVWRGHRVESTALPSIDQNIMDLSSHPNSLIRMQACRSHHPPRPWTTYLHRNERAMAFPGVDSVIGSNSGLA